MIDAADSLAVEQPYIDKATKLAGQMEGNIKAQETLTMLVDYPVRVYPEPEETDPKKKDKKAKAPPKKKKRKEPPFPYPAWAEDL